jgi:hypothetical protein
MKTSKGLLKLRKAKDTLRVGRVGGLLLPQDKNAESNPRCVNEGDFRGIKAKPTIKIRHIILEDVRAID